MAMETPREREIAAEDSIKVVCRFRPLNDSEEKAGSKFIVKFPSGGDENCISIGVRGALHAYVNVDHSSIRICSFFSIIVAYIVYRCMFFYIFYIVYINP